MTAELPPKERTATSARVLNLWLRDAQRISGVGEKRIGWLLASTVAVAALQRALGVDQQPLFLVKGGLFMEFHLGLRARVTKDIDALFRGSLDQFEAALDAAIAEPWGPFALQRTELEEIAGARRLVKPRRFDVKLLVKGAVWRRVQIEVSFPEGHIADVAQPIPAPSAAFFGIATPDHLAGIAMAYQVAQKLHASTDPDDPPAFLNDRVRDLPDLLLIKDHFYPDGPTAELAAACMDVFNARAAEAATLGMPARNWPPRLVAPNSDWRRNYPTLADAVGITLTLDEAIEALNGWVREIGDAAR
jgi:Nucleotidyl transferase AbiEii toxin, Type IV TA system